MKVIELKYLNELHNEFHSMRFEDETFAQFVERTTDDGIPIWKDEVENTERDKKLCKLCKKPVNYEEWDNFSGMHSRCENESYDCLSKEEDLKWN